MRRLAQSGLLVLMLLSGGMGVAAERWYKPVHAEAGMSLFAQHCASCHGAGGEGAPGWQKPGPDGKALAPPLNGSGHAWHHPLKQLYSTIRQGGVAGMPAWGDKLSGAETLAIIARFQSWWSDDIYLAWSRMNDQDAKPR